MTWVQGPRESRLLHDRVHTVGPDYEMSRTFSQLLDGYSDEEAYCGPSDDEDDDRDDVWRHKARLRPCILENVEEEQICTLRVTEDGAIVVNFPSEDSQDMRFENVSAFISTFRASNKYTNENDKWVVKVVYCKNPRLSQQIKTVEHLFQSPCSSSATAERTLADWATERGFDFCREDEVHF
jgi:hypothetical protein